MQNKSEIEVFESQSMLICNMIVIRAKIENLY
jgi:hypothetical protein